MARKIFWGLWMTVWPAVALIPPLVTAQGPARAVTVAQDDSIVTPTKRVAAPVELASPQTELTLEELPNTPQLDVPSPDPFEPKLSESKAPTHRISQPSAPHGEKAFDAEAFDKSEPLPAAGNDTVPQSPRTNVRLNSPRRTGPELTAQEERAQKLIHERALLRAQQRHTRLAVKQWVQTTPRIVGKSTNWHPQTTQPNALAEFDRIENP
ncbi:MAG: hypothetical protein JWN70_365 [Planctomycetaceae bacterium]|nr:hypothetical protein [Planctomycetaceae bacterium]